MERIIVCDCGGMGVAVVIVINDYGCSDGGQCR